MKFKLFPLACAFGLLAGCSDTGTNEAEAPQQETKGGISTLLDSLGIRNILADSAASIWLGSRPSEPLEPTDTFKTAISIRERTSHFAGDSLFVFDQNNNLLLKQPSESRVLHLPLNDLPLGTIQFRLIVKSGVDAIWDTVSVVSLGITVTDTLRDTSSLGFEWKPIPAHLFDSIQVYSKYPYSDDSTYLGTIRSPDSTRYFIPDYQVLGGSHYIKMHPFFRKFGRGKPKALELYHIGIGPAYWLQGFLYISRLVPGADHFFVRLNDSLKVLDYRTWKFVPAVSLESPNDIEFNAKADKALLTYCNELVEMRISDYAVVERHPLPEGSDSCAVQADFVNDTLAVVAREGDDFGTENLRLFHLRKNSFYPAVPKQEFFTPDLKVTEDGQTIYAGEMGLTASTMSAFKIRGDSLVINRSGGLDEDVPRGVFLVDHDSTVIYSDQKFSTSQFGTTGGLPRPFYPEQVSWISVDQKYVYMENMIAETKTGKLTAKFPMSYSLIPTSDPDLVVIAWSGKLVVFPKRLIPKS